MKHDSTVNKAIYYIETNLDWPLTLNVVATHGGQCKTSFFVSRRRVMAPRVARLASRNPLIARLSNPGNGYAHYEKAAEKVKIVLFQQLSHFHRIFQQALGYTISDYIRFRRLAQAASLLIQSDRKILELAFDFQFESQEAFTRAFKKVYRLPPGKYRKLMTPLLRQKEETTMTQAKQEPIKGWFLSGSTPYSYEMGIDHKVYHHGRSAGYLKSLARQEVSGFATMMQEFRADAYRGKRLKLSGFLKTENVERFSGLWMRVDDASSDILQFDNMSNRPLKDSQNWNHYAIVLDIPDTSAVISFGVLLEGKGCIWVDSLKFDVVSSQVPTTNLDFAESLPDQPVNLSFEESD
ncbi:AraC family transcriptional regulator [Alkalihalobacillus oceani]|uniref:AraC family transcriptional regulator n=1 Tax=Halalkalibacter oceani TaxID=1653776 RepID=A0A9X2DRZ5_9BACI|nr:AraC family transcriptional regulator [Halalkalibacter oceani]MCM3715383.1 AraC family transcriptional regulator [Halalkalibacter oceani]